MMDDNNSEETAVYHAAKETVYTTNGEESNDAWKDDADKETNQEDMTVLPSKDFVFLQIFNVLYDFFALVDHDPSHVCPHEPFFDRIRVFFFIGFQVMTSVIAAPLDG